MSQMKAPEWMRETWNRIDDAEEFQEKPSLGWIETSFEPCGAPTAFANLFNRERILKIWIIDRVYPSFLLRNCFKSFMAAVPSNAVFVQGFMFREISPQRRTNKSGVSGIIKTSSFSYCIRQFTGKRSNRLSHAFTPHQSRLAQPSNVLRSKSKRRVSAF